MAKVAKSITPQDRAFLEMYALESNVQMIRPLRGHSCDGLTEETLPAIARLAPITPDTPAVTKASTAKPIAKRIGNVTDAPSMSATAAKSLSHPSVIATPAYHMSNAVACRLARSTTVSLFGTNPERPWTGEFVLAPFPPPQVLLANRPELSI